VGGVGAAAEQRKVRRTPALADDMRLRLGWAQADELEQGGGGGSALARRGDGGEGPGHGVVGKGNRSQVRAADRQAALEQLHAEPLGYELQDGEGVVDSNSTFRSTPAAEKTRSPAS
jgi:hypothetical protein